MTFLHLSEEIPQASAHSSRLAAPPFFFKQETIFLLWSLFSSSFKIESWFRRCSISLALISKGGSLGRGFISSSPVLLLLLPSHEFLPMTCCGTPHWFEERMKLGHP